MPISGIVVTLDADSQRAEAALVAMRARAELTIGPRQGLRTPMVIDAPTVQAQDDLWRWLQGLAGVKFVDVAFVDLEDSASDEPGGPQ